MGIHSLPARRWGRVGLVALLGLTLALFTVTASRAGASDWHKAGATVAKKKKCKKKKKHSASSAKKKKCKKKKHATPVAPPVTPKGPIERLLVQWTSGGDIDGHAWSDGLHDGWNESLDIYELQIPGTTYQHASIGSERVVETNPNPSRPMTFGLCYYAGPGSTDAGDTDITVTTVFANGSREVDNLTLSYGDALTDDASEGGPPSTDVSDWCPPPF
jgi:hypothetical protein